MLSAFDLKIVGENYYISLIFHTYEHLSQIYESRNIAANEIA